MGDQTTVKVSAATIRKCIVDDIDAAGLWRIPGAEGEERTHFVGAEPFPLTSEQVGILHKLGETILRFYNSVNDLYIRTGPDWAKAYLDIGKGEDLIRHASMKYQRRALPGVLRPDILITEDGFVITELDSVPGGMGHLDCLSEAYSRAGFEVLGSGRGMRDGFAAMLRDAAGFDDPVCAIVVSEESADYLPEMVYLAGELRKIGLRAHTVRPGEVVFAEDGLFIETMGEKLRVDVVYRFFELFDILNIPKSELLAYAARKKLVVVTPPYKHYLEEKLLLALLHHEALREHWLASLGEDGYALLKSTFAPTWILDNRPVPPHAEIAGFRWRCKPIRDWREIENATQKERRLVIKPSGFSPLAWGARGVKVGHDMPETEWAKSVEEALAGFDKLPYVLQPFQDTALFGVKYFAESCGEPREIQARVRLCPYYFVSGGRANLGGVLATACPKDKKLIHGMSAAVMTPCRVRS
ncbi:MAG: hypothetical protein M1133_08235 [Armatimonadetes bacterium]|nr:hypothetical protein [Armatimonadota bacterium]